jgi:hypothetical protein
VTYTTRRKGMEREVQIRNKQGVVVALVYTDQKPSDQYELADLFAAAPELLAALRLMVISVTEDIAPDGYRVLGPPTPAAVRQALAAIDKALGAANTGRHQIDSLRIQQGEQL